MIDLAKLTNLATTLQAKHDARPVMGKGAWFDIRNADGSASIYLYDEIGGWGISSSDFIAELRDLNTATIDLHINSPGGSVFEGVAIFSALKAHSATIVCTIDAVAASAASFIAMAGDEIRMAKHARMMIHEASGLCGGRARDMRDMADLLDQLNETLAEAYADRAGGTIEEWLARLGSDNWLNARMCVEMGLADSILGVEESTETNSVTVPPVTGVKTEAENPVFDMHAFRRALLAADLRRA